MMSQENTIVETAPAPSAAQASYPGDLGERIKAALAQRGITAQPAEQPNSNQEKPEDKKEEGQKPAEATPVEAKKPEEQKSKTQEATEPNVEEDEFETEDEVDTPPAKVSVTPAKAEKPKKQELPILEDIQAIINKGNSTSLAEVRKEIKDYLDTYDTFDLASYSQEDVLNLYVKSQHPSFTDEDVIEYISENHPTQTSQKILYEQALKELGEKEESRKNQIKERYKNFAESYRQDIEAREQAAEIESKMRESWENFVSSESASISGVKLRKSDLQAINESIKPYQEDGTFIGRLFFDSETGEFDHKLYMEILLSKGAEKGLIDKKIADKFKRARTKINYARVAKELGASAMNINTRGEEKSNQDPPKKDPKDAIAELRQKSGGSLKFN